MRVPGPASPPRGLPERIRPSDAAELVACVGTSTDRVSAVSDPGADGLASQPASLPVPSELRDAGFSRAMLTGMRRLLRDGWGFLRQVSGDDAYDRYLAHMTLAHPDQPVLGRSAYFRSRQEQRWNRISRCC